MTHPAENDALRAMLDDERAAKKVAADSADRFRDVLSECLGYEDENPGDDVLVAELREHFGKTGPEPTRWRDFITGALAVVDQINAERVFPRPDQETPMPNAAPECECAMTEASFRACPLHGEKAFCPECGVGWLDHPSTCPIPPGGTEA